MASRETSTSRHREPAHKKRRKPREQSSRRTESEGPAGRPLSLAALAQLNEHNTRHPVEEEEAAARERERSRRRKKEAQPQDGYVPVVEPDDDGSPRRERRRRRKEYGDEDERRERRRREAYTTDEERDQRRERRRKEEYRDEEREARRERRRKGAQQQYYTDDEGTGYDTSRRRQRRRYGDVYTDEERDYEDTAKRDRNQSRDGRKKKKRIVSGAIVEEGRATPQMRGGTGSKHSSWDSVENEKQGFSIPNRPPANKKKRKWIVGGLALLLVIIIIIVAVVVSKKNQGVSGSSNKSNLGDVPKDSIPSAAQGTYLDPYSWYDTTDFNVTYTNDTVGGLPVMGLFTDWDDSAKANDKVPALDDDWGDYSKRPARGVNLGGWLSLEPFITPSLFAYDSKLNIIDEWTLSKHLGPKTAASKLEQHYATFVNEQTFKDIRDAGLDHVRIPYSYWAVQTYDDDPYVFRTSWRYLLRAIEWCRKYGLRVNLDLHGLPGSQNGWNHSGRQGPIAWLNGTDGTLNAQRSLDVHDRLSQFFAQDRYRNIIKFYGLANEPRMVFLDKQAVIDWTSSAYKLVRKNGVQANVVFGDGFMGLENWKGQLQGLSGLVLDVHQYVIFNNDQIVYTHQKKVQYACDGWTEQTEQSMSTSTGFGPTMFAEWSQADTDCAKYLTNVGWGNRWEGTYDADDDALDALTPRCPTKDDQCSCVGANTDPSRYSATYKKFLRMFAEAQMVSFEKGWGWWYWTWDTESAPLWSYKQGLAAGILPDKAYDKDFSCDSDVPDFSSGLPETY